MKRKSIPSYLPHRQSGRARAVWTDPSGIRHQRLLPGAFNSAESRAAHARLLLELATSAVVTTSKEPDRAKLSVNELLVAYLAHAVSYYVDPEGNSTKELKAMKLAIKPVRELYGRTKAADFGPLALKAVRQSMIDADLCRSNVNHRIDRIRRVFKWAASEQLVPVAVFDALRTVAGLRKGRSEARESEPVKPVPEDTVKSTLPFLPPHVRVMVEMMLCTGMRPGEVCQMNMELIDRGGNVWLFHPGKHKTQHHGKDRVIPLGPHAQAILLAYLDGRDIPAGENLFSPRRARMERFAALRAGRKSKVQPSQVDRRKGKPKRAPGEKYTQEAITNAVAVACEKAGVEHWFPYQLRHTFGTRVRAAHGLEAAQVLLGHSRADVTQLYAERNTALAVEVAAKIG